MTVKKDYIGQFAPRLDGVNDGLSVFFQRQLEYIESELRFVEYGELKSWKHMPIESRGGDNLYYTYRLYDKVGKWKIGAQENDDVPSIDINGAELQTPIRPLMGGFKYNVQELLAGQQARSNYPNAPSVMIEQQKANATMVAYQQIIDDICWKANPADQNYAGLTGFFYNTNIPTVASAVGGTSGKTTWFNGSGTPQKTFDEVIIDLNNLINSVRINTLDVHAVDTLLMPIKHFTYLANTPTNFGGFMGLTILKFFLMNHPEITSVDTLVPATNVAAGGSIATATDLIVAYKKNPDILKLEIPRTFTMLPIQERGFNYIVPCWATTAGLIVRRPLACAMLTGSSVNGLGS